MKEDIQQIFTRNIKAALEDSFKEIDIGNVHVDPMSISLECIRESFSAMGHFEDGRVDPRWPQSLARTIEVTANFSYTQSG